MNSGGDRLELDERGDPVDAGDEFAQLGGSNSMEGWPSVGADGRPRWADRLRPVLRRHPVVCSLVATAVVAALLGIAVLADRPPAVDFAVRVTLTEQQPPNGKPWLGLENLYASDVTGVDAAAKYQVLVDAGGGEVSTRGIAGPGLRTVLVPDSISPGGYARVATLAATIDCSQVGWSTATADDYRVRLIRTDGYGRTVTGEMPLAARDAAAWLAVVQRQCLHEVLAQATFSGWEVRPQPHDATVVLSVRYRSKAGFPVFLRFPFPSTSGGTAFRVPALGEGVVSTSWPVSACAGLPRVLGTLFGLDDPTTDTVPVDVAVREFSPTAPARGMVDPYQTAVEVPRSVIRDVQVQVVQACDEAGATSETAFP